MVPVLLSNVRAYCWGSADAQLGNGATSGTFATPVAVLAGENEKEYVQVISGDGQNCGITSDGKAYCWGWGSSGQLGNEDTSNQSTPVAVHPGENNGT